MKIQLDTTNKTIKLDSRVKLDEFFSTLEQLLPNGLWEDFTLEVNTIINNWQTPYIWKDIWVRPLTNPLPIYPTYPQPWITCGTNNTNNLTTQLTNGTYNVEV